MEIKMPVPVFKVFLVRENQEPYEIIKINSPQETVSVIREYLKFADREHFGVLMLNNKKEIIGITTVSIGTINAAFAIAREVYKPAILAGAAAILVFHNHTSSDPSPSEEDIKTTHNLQRAGQILGIDLLDHIIISASQAYYSFAENRLLL